uniref:Uncharacterized protein n=1 Tax=Cucumis melo TaxID=3656 RepID=A0A9I9E656_CUCME
AVVATASLLSIEIFGNNLPPFVEAATVTLILRQVSVATSESEASGLCLLQSVFVHEAPTVVVASPRTQPLPLRSPIRMELVAPSILLRSTLPHPACSPRS